MSLLLYCVAPEASRESGVAGVGGVPVRTQILGGLRYFVSEIPPSGMPAVATAAREVLAVVKDICAQGPVLPFRYPTLLQEDAELVHLAAERGESFAEFLGRIGTRVQMDVRLTTDESGGQQVTGSAYLAGRAQRKRLLDGASEQCRQLAETGDWRVEQRGGSYLCHALIGRDEVISFQERMRRLNLPEGVKAVVSGPWPPSGFWEEKLR